MASVSPEAAPVADLLDCVATLSSLLVRVLSKDKATRESLPELHSRLLSKPPIYAFSAPLLNALLAQGSSVTSNQDELLSFIRQHRDTMTLCLDTVSLQCLSSYLLNSSADDGLELGLYLLMDEPEYIATSQSMPSQINPPGSQDLLSLAQRNLLQKVYSIFTSDTKDARVRRMAGKVLTEMLYEFDEHCRLLGGLIGNDELRYSDY
ncbi:uncharacterized protein BDV17DRAFT_290855 [Aspergillus undulatus]|uniref:uncharacterized protein n=1 Tax=Aspergillus undulatus TaxID=1810928 RepID=UPI003CCDEC41